MGKKTQKNYLNLLDFLYEGNFYTIKKLGFDYLSKS